MLNNFLAILTDTISIALETNGRGYLGFIVELPGAFIRGKTQEEALAKLSREITSYMKWLGIRQQLNYRPIIVQTHHCSLMVEDADSEILLDADRKSMSEKEFNFFCDTVQYSGETFLKIYTNAELRDWVDETRIRKTFYGDNPKTINEIFNHVKGCQYYYLSRTQVPFKKIEEDYMKIREFCLKRLSHLYRKHNNSLTFAVDNEQWTLKKILRRFIWHDRIHAKAMLRILERQKQLEMIDKYEDPFYFMSTQTQNHASIS